LARLGWTAQAAVAAKLRGIKNVMPERNVASSLLGASQAEERRIVRLAWRDLARRRTCISAPISRGCLPGGFQRITGDESMMPKSAKRFSEDIML
jgi:hypothetical protein